MITLRADKVTEIPMYPHQKNKLLSDLLFLQAHEYVQFITRIYLFGSCSKGSPTVKSDIDLGIEFTEGVSRWVLSDIRQTLNDDTEFGVETNVSIIPQEDCRFKQEILKGVPLYE